MSEVEASGTPSELRRAAKEGVLAKAELRRLEREVAMLKAGVNVASPVGRMFFNHYEGALDVDVVRSEWHAVSPPPPPVDPYLMPEPVWGDDELRSTEMRSRLAAGSPADQAPTPDPRDGAMDRGKAVLERGGTRDDALAETFQALVEAAMDGDQRVIL